jgi:hypothetical protein
MTDKLTELEQASADRRSYGNPALAANAELKVIAEAMRELVLEVKLLRAQVTTLTSVATVLATPSLSEPLPRGAPARDRAPGAA